MKLTELYKHLRSDLSAIEKELEYAVDADHPDLRKASHHLLKAGGKRIRPVFVLLSGQFGDCNINAMKTVAVALELIHTASLVHDDVIDDSDLRRGRKTIKSKWDNRVAMYTGDYIFARALEMMTDLNQPEVHKLLSYAMVEMSIGEIEQIRDLYDWNQNFRDYLRRIKRKTALLIAASCQLGAVASGAADTVSKNLYAFGYYVGMSFQITDDILDFKGTEKKLGKPAGNDLRQGNLTLPVLYALQNEQIRDDIITFLKSNGREEKQWQTALTLVRESGGIEFSQQICTRYLEKAYGALYCLPDVKARQSLYEIANYIGKRQF
jgi:heptaprenyl diphosphate synthase